MLLIKKRPARQVAPGRARGLAGFCDVALWAVANRLDRVLASPAKRRNVASLGYDVESRRVASDLLPGTAEIEVVARPAPRRRSCELTPEDVAAIGSHGLDVILEFGPALLVGDVVNAARFGIWSCGPATDRDSDPWPFGFREWFDNAGETGAALRVQTDGRDNGQVITKSTYRTYPLSWNENRRRLRDASSLLMLDALANLAEQGAIPGRSKHVFGSNDQRLTTVPEAGVSIAAMAKLIWRYAGRLVVRYAYRDQWRLLIHQGAPAGTPIREFQMLVPPRDRFWADPFLIKREGRLFIFFEDYSFPERRGKISAIEFDGSNVLSYREVMDLPYHLSFPFPFEFEGQLYLLPESVQNKTVEVWRCEEFPAKWERAHVLMEGVAAADTVLFEHDGVWWLFTNLRRVGQQNLAELHIFYAEHPLTKDWVRHPLNPVVRDARHARMGGRVFHAADGRIIRCAQDNRGRYGNGIVFCHVTRLSPDAYEEQIIEDIRPDWSPNIVGTHHFDNDGEFTVIDANVRMARVQLPGLPR